MLILKLIRKIQSDENGATAIEYALIGGLISISIIIGATQLGNTLGNRFQGFANDVQEVSDRY